MYREKSRGENLCQEFYTRNHRYYRISLDIQWLTRQDPVQILTTLTYFTDTYPDTIFCPSRQYLSDMYSKQIHEVIKTIKLGTWHFCKVLFLYDKFLTTVCIFSKIRVGLHDSICHVVQFSTKDGSKWLSSIYNIKILIKKVFILVFEICLSKKPHQFERKGTYSSKVYWFSCTFFTSTD